MNTNNNLGEFVKIKGYEDLYEINSQGQVRSIKKNIILKNQIDRGYCKIELSKNGIEIFSAYASNQKNQPSFLSKLYKIYKTMKTVDANIYYYRCGAPGVVSIFAKLLHKKMIKEIHRDITA